MKMKNVASALKKKNINKTVGSNYDAKNKLNSKSKSKQLLKKAEDKNAIIETFKILLEIKFQNVQGSPAEYSCTSLLLCKTENGYCVCITYNTRNKQHQQVTNEQLGVHYPTAPEMSLRKTNNKQ